MSSSPLRSRSRNEGRPHTPIAWGSDQVLPPSADSVWRVSPSLAVLWFRIWTTMRPSPVSAACNCELHAAETGDGRIAVHIRNHNTANEGETLQTESADGGKTWSLPHAIGVWGLPSFLLRLRSGELLMTYGY